MPYDNVQDRDGGQEFVWRVALGVTHTAKIGHASGARRLSWSRGSLTV